MTTPVRRVGEIWVKHDDAYVFNGMRGGKVRTCVRLTAAGERPDGLVTAGSRHSPQVAIVAAVAAGFGLPARVHVPSGAETNETLRAEAYGAQVLRHLPGYNSVIVSRARADAAKRGWREIPFGMECATAVEATAFECRNLPWCRRIVVAVGSGMSLAGICHGLELMARPTPILGVVVGANPEKRLDKWAPPLWRFRVELVPAGVPYGRQVRAHLDEIELDPVYEAKVLPFLRPDDCLWIVGHREPVWPKHCPYCGAGHAERGRACCPEHAAKLAGAVAAATSGRQRAAAKVLEAARVEYGRRRRWSAVAMGHEAAEHLAALFPGLAPPGGAASGTRAGRPE